MVVCLLANSCIYHPESADVKPTKTTELVNLDCGANYHRMVIIARYKDGSMSYSYTCTNEHPYGVYLQMEE